MPTSFDNHDHASHDPHDPHAHRSLHVVDAPFDPANQSLADALRATFRVLKVFMVLVFVVYLFSGVFTVEQGDQAVILSFGKLYPRVYGPGLHIAWPRPINEVVKLSTGRSNTASVDSQWLQIHENETNTPLASLARPGGLHPARDGVLMTGDKGLVHVRWQVVFHIDDLQQYVRTVKDDSIKQAEGLLRTILEDVAIRNAAGMTADDIIYRQPKALQDAVRRDLNARLAELRTGIEVDKVDIAQSTMPIPTLAQYQQVTRAENGKQTRIRQAEQDASALLNHVAGGAHEALIARLDERERALAAGDSQTVAALDLRIDHMLENEVGGEAGALVRKAQAFYTTNVSRMQSDLEQYRNLLGEYERSPRALIARLWNDARKRILTAEGVTQIYRPLDQKDIVVKIQPDPEEIRKARMKALQQNMGGPPPMPRGR